MRRCCSVNNTPEPAFCYPRVTPRYPRFLVTPAPKEQQLSHKVLTDLYVEKLKPTRGRRVEIFDATFPGLAPQGFRERPQVVVAILPAAWQAASVHDRRLSSINLPAAARPRRPRYATKSTRGQPGSREAIASHRPLPEVETFETVLADYFSQYAADEHGAVDFREAKRGQLERDVLPHWRAMATSRHQRPTRSQANQRHRRGRQRRHRKPDVLAAAGFLNWSIAQLRFSERRSGESERPGKEQARDRALTDDEIRWFWSATEAIGWPFGPIARLLLLTAQRRDEVSKDVVVGN